MSLSMFQSYLLGRPNIAQPLLEQAQQQYDSGTNHLHIVYLFDFIDLCSHDVTLAELFFLKSQGGILVSAYLKGALGIGGAHTRAVAGHQDVDITVTCCPQYIPLFMQHQSVSSALEILCEQNLRDSLKSNCITKPHHPWVEIAGCVAAQHWVYRGSSSRGGGGTTSSLSHAAFHRHSATECAITIFVPRDCDEVVVHITEGTCVTGGVQIGGNVKVIGVIRIPEGSTGSALSNAVVEAFLVQSLCQGSQGVPSNDSTPSHERLSLSRGLGSDIVSSMYATVEKDWAMTRNMWSQHTDPKYNDITVLGLLLCAASLLSHTRKDRVHVVVKAHPHSLNGFERYLQTLGSSMGVPTVVRVGSQQSILPEVTNRDVGGITQVTLQRSPLGYGDSILLFPRIDLLKQSQLGPLQHAMVSEEVTVASRINSAQHIVRCGFVACATIPHEIPTAKALEKSCLMAFFDLVLPLENIACDPFCWFDDFETLSPPQHCSRPTQNLDVVISPESFQLLQAYYLRVRSGENQTTTTTASTASSPLFQTLLRTTTAVTLTRKTYEIIAAAGEGKADERGVHSTTFLDSLIAIGLVDTLHHSELRLIPHPIVQETLTSQTEDIWGFVNNVTSLLFTPQ